MHEPAPSPLWHRLGWLVLIWLSSVSTLGFVAGVIRWWLRA